MANNAAPKTQRTMLPSLPETCQIEGNAITVKASFRVMRSQTQENVLPKKASTGQSMDGLELLTAAITMYLLHTCDRLANDLACKWARRTPVKCVGAPLAGPLML